MAQLPIYNNFDEKREIYNTETVRLPKTEIILPQKINSLREFKSFYNYLQRYIKSRLGSENKDDFLNTDFIFRGINEAKYKIFNSGQRLWISEDMSKWWSPQTYLEYIDELIKDVRDRKLFNKVFDYYHLQAIQRDFPILSIMQHYTAPTPLLDFTHDLDVALYFAVKEIDQRYTSESINDYFSIYMIDNSFNNSNALKSIFDITNDSFPRLKTFDNPKSSYNEIFYISDFDDKKRQAKQGNRLQSRRPITTIYNQNIIPQQGLFIFNQSPDKPLEEVFRTSNRPILYCFDIHKSLAIDIRNDLKTIYIDEEYVYPDLKKICEQLAMRFLDKKQP